MSELFKKRKARKIRPKSVGHVYVSEDETKMSSTPMYEGQYPSTHLMQDNIPVAEGNKYKVWPSITTDSESKEGYKFQSLSDAEKKEEVFTFKSRKKAEKFARGSWKKGKDKRDAMKEYRLSKN